MNSEKTAQSTGTTGPVVETKRERNTVAFNLGSERNFRFDKDRIVIGSVVSADVRLTGEGIAPIHAVLENGAEAVLYDLASETGVFVNGKRVVTQALKDGDKVTIGQYTLDFKQESVKQVHPKERFRESDGRKLFLSETEDFTPLLLEEEREIEEIFDFRPTSKQALEIVMSWNEVVLDVEHFVRQKSIVLGDSKRSNFGIPPVLTSKKHPLVMRVGEQYVLNVDPNMKGVIQRKGELRNLETLRERFTTGAHGVQVPLEKDDFAKLSVGDISFYLSFTAAPPRLKMSRLFERDPLFLKIFASSMLLTAFTVALLLNANVPQTLEAEQIPERIATILYQPEKYAPRPKVEKPRVPETKDVAVTPPSPSKTAKPVPIAKIDIKPSQTKIHKPVPKVMNVAQNKPKAPSLAQNQAKAKEGQGARAKGKEGVRGSPTAAPLANQQPQTAAFRPSPQGGTGRGGGNSQVPDIGNVDFLKTATGKIEDILGNSAARLGKGGEKLRGFGGFNTLGNGGLALSGTGKGGGGTAESLGGLSDRGKGGGRVGTGLGAAGSGAGIIGGQSRVVIRSGGPEEAVVMGSIDADAVEAALREHRDEFRLCYERELNAENPKLSGRVGTTFVIGSSGKVMQAGIESTTLKHANAERCILTVIKRIQFPIPRGAGLVQVTYPFKFVPLK